MSLGSAAESQAKAAAEKADEAKKAPSLPPTRIDGEGEVELRTRFADWMTAPENPRFAMTIANRLWKRAFGVGVREPVTDLDVPEASVNPALLRHLAAEMVRLDFYLKQFMRLLYNTQTYQR